MHEERLVLLCALVAIVLQGSRFRDHGILLALAGILVLLWHDHREAMAAARRARYRLPPPPPGGEEGLDDDAPPPAPDDAPPPPPEGGDAAPPDADADPGWPEDDEADNFGTFMVENSAPVPRWGRYADQLRARPRACEREGPPVWHKRDRLARINPLGTHSMFRDTTGQTSRFSHLR